MLKIRELPAAERPRERILLRGVSAAQNRDLIAVLLNSGTRTMSALGLADKLLAEFGTLPALAEASIEELSSIPGIGVAKAVRISAACELGRRIHSISETDRPLIRSAADVSRLLQGQMRFLDREKFVTVLLDTKHRVIGMPTVSVGHLSGALVHPREVFKAAIRRSSAAIILVHNHPSGDPTPSREDILVTRRLVEAGRILGIEVLDHVILGGQRFTSLRQEGYLPG